MLCHVEKQRHWGSGQRLLSLVRGCDTADLNQGLWVP